MRSFAKCVFSSGLTQILLSVALAQSHTAAWLTIDRANLCVTEGAIEKAGGDRLSVDAQKMRAYVTAATSQSAEIRFRYAGPTHKESALGSGQMRRQFGFKLRAQDPCNLVYAIWRIDPESKFVVSLKRNPSQHTSAQCGNRGYSNIKPRKSSAVPRLQPGDSHTLRAEMKGQDLRVFVDNHEVWDGDIGPAAASLAGPVGIRSDNASLEFDFKARAPDSTHAPRPWPCKAGDSD